MCEKSYMPWFVVEREARAVTMTRVNRLAWMVVVVVSCLALDGAITLQGSVHAESEVPVTNPFSGDDKAIEEGRSWFMAVCAPCHGPRANGAAERGPSGADLRTFKRGFEQYVHTVKNGREGRIGKMPRLGYLSDEQIFQIGAFLETLAIEGAHWGESEIKP